MQPDRSKSHEPRAKSRRHPRRGFILLVMVGLMAVMLIVVIGFLSNTRSEVTYVTGLRNQTECNNALQSGLDFTLGAIIHDTFDASGDQMDPKKFVAICRDSKDPNYKWWYKPNVEMSSQNLGSIEDQTDWCYLPANFSADGTTRMRVRVQVSDTNGNININGWLDSGIPTQAQMGNMLMETCDYNFAERQRAALLTTYSGTAPFNGGSILPAAKYTTFNCPGNGHAAYNPAAPAQWCPYHSYPLKLRRYMDCWRAGSRTFSGATGNYINYYKWSTLNEPYFMDLAQPGGAQGTTIDTIYSASQTEQGLQGGFAGYDLGYYLFIEGRYATYHTCYTDPDTGRSPVNVNTGVPPGYYWAGNTWQNVGFENYNSYMEIDRVLKGVFNINSMKHLVRIGTFPFKKGATTYHVKANWLWESPLSTVNPVGAPLSTWSATEIENARRKVEEYRVKVAYQYQETLVRYFTAFYDNYANWYPGCYPWVAPGYTSKYGTYTQRYGTLLGSANSGPGQVKYFCPSYRLGSPRFPFGLDQFRTNVKADLLAMTVHARNTAFNDGSPASTESESGTVSIDDNGNFEIFPGKLDRRLATAIYDNIVPGQQTLWDTTSPGKYPQTAEEKFPIKQLYDMKLARDENAEVWYEWPETEGGGTVPVGPSTPASSGFPKTIPRQMGKTIALENATGVGSAGKELGPWEARSHVPERQLMFSPDCFSTELTTSTTTYVIVVAAQMVDTSQSISNPAVIFNRHVAYTVELAPDVENETKGANDWASTGLAYYKTGQPRARLTDKTLTDDKLATPPLARNDRTGKKIKGSDTSAALDWFDFRGVAAGQENTFYDSPAQTKRHIVVRRVTDFSFND